MALTNEDWLRRRMALRTAEEWLACDYLPQMFRVVPGKASDRKARLFEAACWLRLWAWQGVERCRWAVEVLEQQADVACTADEVRPAAAALRQAREAATWVMGGMWNQAFDEQEEHQPGAWPTAGRTAEAMSIAAGRLALQAAGREDGRPEHDDRAAEDRAQCHLLRDVVANPFRPLPPPDAAWLRWNGGLVVKLAERVYDQRLLPSGGFDPALVGVLADALEEAGGAGELLQHLRGPGPHVRGCLAVDALLGKA
jgi:hypothetical protein